MKSFSYVYTVMRDKPLTPMIMNFKRFNRHELFDAFLMEWHSTTIRNVSNYIWETNGEVMSELENMLCGIWDGYLYDELLTKALILPKEDYRRIEDTVKIINEHIKANGESVTQIF
jgi:hypothetical protein